MVIVVTAAIVAVLMLAVVMATSLVPGVAVCGGLLMAGRLMLGMSVLKRVVWVAHLGRRSTGGFFFIHADPSAVRSRFAY